MKRIILAMILTLAVCLSSCGAKELEIEISGERLSVNFTKTDAGYTTDYELPLAGAYEPDFSFPTNDLCVINAYIFKNTAFLTVAAHNVCDVYVYDIENNTGKWLSGDEPESGDNVGAIPSEKNYIVRADGNIALLRRSVVSENTFEGEYYMIDLDTLETCFISKSYATDYLPTSRVECFEPVDNCAGYRLQVWNSDNAEYYVCTLTNGKFEVRAISEQDFFG